MRKATIVAAFIGIFFAICTTNKVNAQDKTYARNIIDTLASPSMHGRGYVFDGVNIAAKYLSAEMGKLKLKPFETGYMQWLSYPVNTFPEEQQVKINGKELTLGKEYMIHPSATTCKGTFKIKYINIKTIKNAAKFQELAMSDLRNTFILIDNKGIKTPEEKKLMDNIIYFPLNSRGIILLDEKLFAGGVLKDTLSRTIIHISQSAIKGKLKTIETDIKNKFINDFKTCNIIGMVEGKVRPDSFLVFTAHYDHIGMMGPSIYYPGANDNASGVAMTLDLARYFSDTANRPKYSIVFMLLTGEETGLLGSRNYVDHPYFPLKKIKFLVNLDLVANGEDGICVVNGAELTQTFEKLQNINKINNYVTQIKPRGRAANSDHHSFYEEGVDAFFIYALGGKSPYHSPDDTVKNISLFAYDGLFKLLLDFVRIQ